MSWKQTKSPNLDNNPSYPLYVYVGGQILTDWYGWCATKGNYALGGDRKLVDVSEVKVGDILFASDGKTPVKVLANVPREAKVIEVDIHSIGKTKLTPEHPVITLVNDKPEFKPIGSLKPGDFVATPSLESATGIALTNDELRYIGFWIGDGYRAKEQKVETRPDRKLSFGKIRTITKYEVYGGDKKQPWVDGLCISQRKAKYKGLYRWTLRKKQHPELVKVLDMFDGGSQTKDIPLIFSKEEARLILEGYFASDGSPNTGLGSTGYRALTASKKLSLCLSALGRMAGYTVSVATSNNNPEGCILGRKVTLAPHYYTLSFTTNNSSKYKVKEVDGVEYHQIKSIEDAGTETVYSIGVDGDHTYLLNTFSSHNCLAVVAKSFGASGSSYSAKTAWQSNSTQHRNFSIPYEVYVPLWYEGGEYGHVVIGYRKGDQITVWSSPYTHKATFDVFSGELHETLDYIGRVYGVGAYTGWTETVLESRVIEEVNDTPAPKPEPKPEPTPEPEPEPTPEPEPEPEPGDDDNNNGKDDDMAEPAKPIDQQLAGGLIEEASEWFDFPKVVKLIAYLVGDALLVAAILIPDIINTIEATSPQIFGEYLAKVLLEAGTCILLVFKLIKKK